MDNNNQNPIGGSEPPENPQPTWPPPADPQPAQPPPPVDPLTPNLSFNNIPAPQEPFNAPPQSPPQPAQPVADNPYLTNQPLAPNLTLEANPPSSFPPPPQTPMETASTVLPVQPLDVSQTTPPQAPWETPTQSLGVPPLENPAPPQPGAVDTQEPLPAAPPQIPNPNALDGSTTQPPPAQPPSPLTGPLDSAPTDLSHLIGNNEQQVPPEIYNPTVSTQEGPGGTPPPPQTPTQPNDIETAAATGLHFNLSKILIIVGVVVLLLVSGLSAYFFFGPGKSTQPTQSTSVPAQQASQPPLTNPPKQVINTPTVAPVATASASSTFGAVGNESSSSGQTALDLLRSRQSSATPRP